MGPEIAISPSLGPEIAIAPGTYRLEAALKPKEEVKKEEAKKEDAQQKEEVKQRKKDPFKRFQAKNAAASLQAPSSAASKESATSSASMGGGSGMPPQPLAASGPALTGEAVPAQVAVAGNTAAGESSGEGPSIVRDSYHVGVYLYAVLYIDLSNTFLLVIFGENCYHFCWVQYVNQM